MRYLVFILFLASAPAWADNGNGNPSGGSGNTTLPVRIITSGSTDTAALSDYEIVWDKTSGSASAETLPACNAANNGRLFVVTDGKGDAATNNITVAASSGTITNQANYLLYLNTQSATFHCNGGKTNYTVN